MLSLWWAILTRDIQLYLGKGGDVLTILSFFLIALVLFPFALGADNPNTATYAPAFIWLIALLASLLSLPSILQKDFEDGTLDQLRRTSLSMEWCVLAKILANWIACQLPLLLFSPLAALLLGADATQIPRILVSLLVGTPVLSAIGTMGAALTLHNGSKTNLLAILVLPLYIPALIFAAIVALASPALPFLSMPEMQVSLALIIGMIPLSCLSSAALIRLQG